MNNTVISILPGSMSATRAPSREGIHDERNKRKSLSGDNQKTHVGQLERCDPSRMTVRTTLRGAVRFSPNISIIVIVLLLIILMCWSRADASEPPNKPGDLDYTAVMTNEVFSIPDIERGLVYCNDMDRDGVDEIIVGTELGTVYVIDPVDGSTIMNLTLPYSWIFNFVAGNVDDDQGMELIIEGSNLTCIDFDTGTITWNLGIRPSLVNLVINHSSPSMDLVFVNDGNLYRINGKGEIGYSNQFIGNESLIERTRASCIGDVDGDGVTELVITSSAGTYSDYIWILDVETGELEYFNGYNLTFSSPPVLVDVGGRIQITIGLENTSWKPYDLLFIDGRSFDTELLSIPHPFERARWRFLIYSPMDGGSICLMTDRGKSVVWLMGNSSISWTEEGSDLFGGLHYKLGTPPLVCDIDHDGTAELMILASNLLIRDYSNGDEESRIEFSEGQYSYQQIFLGDFDGDGFSEIGCKYYEYTFTNTTYVAVVDTPRMSLRLSPGSVQRGATLYPINTYPLIIEIANMTPGRVPSGSLHMRFHEEELGETANLSIGFSDGELVVLDGTAFWVNIGEVKNDGLNLTVPLSIEPMWNITSEGFHAIEVEFIDKLGIRINATFHDHFKVETDLVFEDPLTILDPDGEPVAGNWVRPGDSLSVSSPVVVFEGSGGLQAPVDSYIIEIMMDNQSANHSVSEVGEWIPFEIPIGTTEPVIEVRVYDVHQGVYSVSVFKQELMLDSDPPEIVDHFPTASDWFSSETVVVGIRFVDNDSGVDLYTLRYSLAGDDWVDVDPEKIFATESYLSVEILMSFPEGRNLLRWSLDDNVGHSMSYSQNVNVDLTKIIFSEFRPSGWQNTTRVECSVTLTDINGSGIDGDSIEFAYSSTDVFSFTPWTSIGPVDTGENVTVDFVVESVEGGRNLLIIRGRDIAGNEAISSEIYSLNIDVTSPEMTALGFISGQVRSPFNRTILVRIVEAGSTIDVIIPTLVDGDSGEELDLTYSLHNGRGDVSMVTITWSEGSNFNLIFLLSCTDVAGNKGSMDDIEFSINRPPRVEIVSPVDGKRYGEKEEITISYLIEDPEQSELMIILWLDGVRLNLSDDNGSLLDLALGTHTISLDVNDEFYNVSAKAEFEVYETRVENSSDSWFVLLSSIVLIIFIVSVLSYVRWRRNPASPV